MNEPSPRPAVSVVSPVYLAEESISDLVRSISQVLARDFPHFEIVLVDDGSPDGSWPRIVAMASEDPRVRGVRLSRNFGQHAAITAGLAHARGELVIVMDCDLQDDPADIPAFIAKAAEGHEIVFGQRPKREHPGWKNLTAGFFFWIFNLLTDASWKRASKDIGSYTLLTRKAVDAFLRVHDAQRHFLMILRWLGFSQGYVTVTHRPRPRGRSSYTIPKLLRHALAGITAQSNRLLYASVIAGLGYAFFAGVGIVWLIVQYLTRGSLEGWTSLAVILLSSTGLILTAIGILGIYLGNVFDQVRNRPLYLVAQTLN